MPTTKYIVRLSQEEHDFLESVVKKGKGGAFKIRRAQILLHSDVNGPGASAATIAKIRRWTPLIRQLDRVNKL